MGSRPQIAAMSENETSSDARYRVDSLMRSTSIDTGAPPPDRAGSDEGHTTTEQKGTSLGDSSALERQKKLIAGLKSLAPKEEEKEVPVYDAGWRHDDHQTSELLST